MKINYNYRKTGSSKTEVPLYKKRNMDFTDYAYKEAVNRLKFLLNETYSPTKLSTFYNRHFEDSGDDTDNQSVLGGRPAISEISKYIPPTSNLSRYESVKKLINYPTYTAKESSYPTTSSFNHLKVSPSPIPIIQTTAPVAAAHLSDPLHPPPELLNFIEKQENYIEQLEKESQFCRGELSTLLNKVKDVISENETLTDQAKSSLPRSLFPNETSESDDIEIHDFRKTYPKPRVPLEGPNIVFESRISELEAQLAQSGIDIKRLHDENESNKRKLNAGTNNPGDPMVNDAYKKQIETLSREKINLEEKIRKMETEIYRLKDSDANNFTKTQRNRDLAEQALFDRQQSDLEIRRLKDELERQHERIRELQHEMAKRIAEERAQAERRYTYQVDQLGGDLSSQWEHTSKLQLELERQKRIESDLKRDIAQRNAQIDELKSEIKSKTASFLSDIAQVNAEKQSVEQEITSMR